MSLHQMLVRWIYALMICGGIREEGVDPVSGGTGTENCVTGDIRLLANLKAGQLNDPL